jgi:diguanylate cyclase (GGDEF)-like protein
VREIEVARRNGAPLAMALFDIDHFKRINDEHGHRTGDAVLRQIARLLLNNTRKSDILCRFGGEEFVLLMPNATVEQAHSRAEAVLAIARAHLVAHEGKSIRTVTLSAGIAAWVRTDADFATVLEAADAALYAAKHAGRDRAVRAPSIAALRAA